MNEQLNNTLIDILKSAQGATVQATAFLQAQMPELIKEILAWGFYSSLLSLSVAFLLFGICVFFTTRYFRESEGASMMALIPALFCVLVFVHDGPKMMKVCVAPRLYLIDYVTDLVKHGGNSYDK